MSKQFTVGKMVVEGTGGEGAVYEVGGQTDLLFKKYKPGRCDDELVKKLRYMTSHVPVVDDPMSHFAWPEHVMEDSTGPVGFLMPKLKFDRKLDEVYAFRRPWLGDVDYLPNLYRSRVKVARNLCVMVKLAHENHFVIGDFNHGNVGVDSKTGIVSMFDCDSFHLANGVYRCRVGMPGYIAPELLAHVHSGNTDDLGRAVLPTFTEYTDLFALAVHIFRLLMNGVPPYSGIDPSLTSSTATIGAGNAPVEAGAYCFAGSLKPMSPLCPPMTILPDIFAQYFMRAFLGTPSRRPTAIEWIKVLDAYEKNLRVCSKSRRHWYHKGLTCCPWCEADVRQQQVDNHQTRTDFTVKRQSGYEAQHLFAEC